MWIYGYNEAKQMVEVNLPMETVLAEQIDPWRLDLCDPDPVVCQTNQGELRLISRLTVVALFLCRTVLAQA